MTRYMDPGTLPKRFSSVAAANRWLSAHVDELVGHVTQGVVLHDDRCLHGRGTACTCAPEIVVEGATAKGFRRRSEETQRWLARHRMN